MMTSLSYSATEQRSLVDLLRSRADGQPHRRAYTFLAGDETESHHLTYAELDRQARCVGARLQQMDAAGRRVLLLCPPGIHFLTGFFGCLYAGAIAVPVPHTVRTHRANPRLEAIVRNAGVAIVLTVSQLAAKLERHPDRVPALAAARWLAIDGLDESQGDDWQAPPVGRESLAALQYTSGSISDPKGVMLTHGNFLYNLGVIHRRCDVTEADCAVHWVPPYHDLGLVAAYLESLYGGYPVVLMTPMAFLQRPIRWLRAIECYGGTISGGPTFAFEECVRRISPEERAGLDLSSWRLAFVGAEPVRHQTLTRFQTAFGGCGFAPTTFYPAYGLAESTLMATGGDAGAPFVTLSVKRSALAADRIEPTVAADPDAQLLVGCGHPMDGHSLFIVDPDSQQPLPDGEIGEIWVSGPSVAQGYWRNPAATEQGFVNIAQSTEDHTTLAVRTGDLGFLHGGELYVAGRLAEMLIFHGFNYFPQDIEQAVDGCHPALNAGGAAAFSVEVEEQERLAIVLEVNRRTRHVDTERVAAAVRGAVSEVFDLETYAVILIGPGRLPRTTSGKIQRRHCRKLYQAGELAVLGQSLRRSAGTGEGATVVMTGSDTQRQVEQVVRAWLSKALSVSAADIDLKQSMPSLGFGSLQAASLKSQLDETFGIEIDVQFFLEAPTLAAFVELVADLAEGRIEIA